MQLSSQGKEKNKLPKIEKQQQLYLQQTVFIMFNVGTK